jgi:hypothetical protein
MPFAEEIKSLVTPVLPANTVVYLTSGASIPPGNGPYVSLIETPGLSEVRTQNMVATPAYERPHMQVVVRSSDYLLARVICHKIYRALRGVRNQLVGVSSVAVTSIVRSGTTATVTAPSHGFVTDQEIVIAGAGQAEYNGTKTITEIDVDSFSFSVSGSPVTPATGTITASYPGTRYVEIRPIQPPFDMGVDANSRARVVFNLRAHKGSS